MRDQCATNARPMRDQCATNENHRLLLVADFHGLITRKSRIFDACQLSFTWFHIWYYLLVDKGLSFLCCLSQHWNQENHWNHRNRMKLLFYMYMSMYAYFRPSTHIYTHSCLQSRSREWRVGDHLCHLSGWSLPVTSWLSRYQKTVSHYWNHRRN